MNGVGLVACISWTGSLIPLKTRFSSSSWLGTVPVRNSCTLGTGFIPHAPEIGRQHHWFVTDAQTITAALNGSPVDIQSWRNGPEKLTPSKSHGRSRNVHDEAPMDFRQCRRQNERVPSAINHVAGDFIETGPTIESRAYRVAGNGFLASVTMYFTATEITTA
jgi:hypothetical protein